MRSRMMMLVSRRVVLRWWRREEVPGSGSGSGYDEEKRGHGVVVQSFVVG